MKRIVYFTSIFFLISLITSCQKEIQKDESNPISEGGVTVNVVADGNLVSDDASKTVAVVDGTTTKFKWTEGDAITLYEYVDGTLNDKKDSNPATISDDGYSATFTVKLTKEDPEGSNYVYTACYPTGAFTSTSNYDRYQIPNTQTLTADGNFDPAADIMFGKAESRTSRVTDATNLEFSFKRLGTVVKLTLKGIVKDEAINNITITAPEKITGYSEINFKTGVVGKVAYDAVNSLKLNSGEEKIIASGSEDGDVFWFRCIEGTWKEGDKFTIVVDTDKAGYTKEITIPAGGLEFSTGGFTKLTIGSLTRTQKVTTIYNKVTEAPGDWTGEYLLVYENKGKAHIWTGVDDSSCYVEETITDNAITSLPTGAATLTIAKITDGYSIKINGGSNDGKYIGRTKTDNGMDFVETAYLNTISIENNSAKISSSSTVIRYNSTSGQDRFRYYKSGQQAVQLYKLDDNKTLTGIELNTDNVTKEFPVNGEFNYNGLKVTAYYDNGKTADVSESDNLTVTPPDMTTAGENKEVTVTYKEGDAEFSKTYKINVIEGTISVESISLNKTELSIQIEKTETLVATIKPETASNKGIVWSSDKEGIATVNESGVVTGVAVGTATITATSEENENISASCTVNVTPKVEVVEISLNNSFYGVTKGNNGAEQTKTTDDGVTVVSGCLSSASSKTYYDTSHIRYYTDSYLKVSVEGTISEIVFTAGGTWNGSINVGQGTYTDDTKTWTGSAAEVDFSFKAQNRIASIKVSFTPDGTPRYDVSCATVAGGTLSANPSRAKAGESITLTANPENEEYEFNNDWNVTDEKGSPVSVSNNTFIMPESNVTVSGSFTQKTYTIKRGTAEHGTFTINGKADDNQTAHKGDKISVAAEAESGYEHTGWTVTKDTEGTVYVNNGQFTMPNDNVTVTPVFTAAASIPEYASLADLVAAGKPTATEKTVKVTLTNEVITERNNSYICVKSGTQVVKLYKSGVPSDWTIGGTVSGTLKCPWLLYNNTDWELKPNAWTDLTYKAPLKPCSTPVISFNDGKASITSTEGATIKYAINKDENTQPVLTSTYDKPFSVNDGDVVWAQATKDGCLDSEVAHSKYTAGGGETKTYRHVFSAKPDTGDNITLSGVKWNISATNLGSYNSQNYAGVQFGASGKNGQITLTSPSSWSFTADGKTGTKIKEVRLWLNLGGTSVTPKVTIGGKVATSNGTVTKNTSAGKDWTKASKVTFTPAAGGNTGVIVIDVTSVKAGYICAIEIDTEDCN